jgi:deoxyribonuclease-4
MAILGAHMSIAGGLPKAIQRATACGCDCLQLFAKNCSQWNAKPIPAAEIANFRQALAESQLTSPVVHGSYLINLASPDDVLWHRSIAAFLEEFERAEALGIPYVVTHPGAYTAGNPDGGLARVVQALDEIHRRSQGMRVQCLLETTAGQGTSLGWQFEQLASMIGGVRTPERLGVCFDTCHVFAAGYALGTPRDYRRTMTAFDKTVGLERIKAFHLNDSKRELGSRVDRHAHIGRGRIGLDAFRCLVNDSRFCRVPMYLETPKGTEDGVDLDMVNLGLLRSLTRKLGRPRASSRKRTGH